ANLLTPTAGNAVYDLWNARQQWLEAKLAEVANQQDQGFTQFISTYIPNLDFDTLTKEDANGQDITSELEVLKLDLAAFRYLAGCLKLSTADALLDTEWQAIRDIVIQVLKKTQYPQWREEESG